DVSLSEGGGPGDSEDVFFIPDNAFGEYLRYNNITGVYAQVSTDGGDTSISYYIDIEEAAKFSGEINLNKSQTFINRLIEAGLNTAEQKITDLDGIQYFPGTTSLTLTSNELTLLDVTQLVNLETLAMNNNWVSELNLTQNTKLVTLSYNGSSSANAPEVSKLSGIDLTKNTQLVSLTMRNHELTYIDLSNNTKLKEVDLSGNTGAPLTIPEEIYNNLTTAVGVQPGHVTPPDQDDYYTVADKALGEYLNYRLQGTDIIRQDGNTYKIDKEKAAAYTGELQLSKANAYLTELEGAGVETARTKITNADGLQWFTGLTSLTLTSNELTAIDLTPLVNLESVTLNNNWISTLDVTKNTKLTVLNYNASTSSSAPENSKLTAINLSQNVALTTLSMTNHAISAIDLSANTALTSVNLSGNTGAPFTIPEEIYNNLTTAEGVEPGTVAADLYTIPDLALAEYLTYRLPGTGIIVKEGDSYQIDKAKAAAYTGELQLSKANAYLTELEEAGVGTARTKITNTDGLQWFTGVTSLTLTSNELTSIDLTTLVNLESLTLNNNWIGTLDLTKNTKLTVLNYNASSSSSAPINSKLTSIDLSQNTLLTTISMTNHAISAIDLSANKALTSVNLTGNTGAPFTIPAEIYNNLTTANGVVSAGN
ncbi:MAG: hypothetical protein LUE93_14415, partial [Bacteroides sp.]|nr:hypothetical protein [Bacteroides sp.]